MTTNQNQRQQNNNNNNNNKIDDNSDDTIKSDYELYYNDTSTVRTLLREIRHNKYWMIPITLIVLILIAVSSFLNLVIQIPTLLLGILLGPIMIRSYWMIEFLYPSTLLRWGHLFLIKLIMKSRSNSTSSTTDSSGSTKTRSSSSTVNEYHSRWIETRIEVISSRIYIHPLPQFLDNIGYVVVCIPPLPSIVPLTSKENNDMNGTTDSIVAILVDCGDADVVIKQLTSISTVHYHKRPIIVHSILSTHKHHDHTAGNITMMQYNEKTKDINDGAFDSLLISLSIQYVFGGAVENVPGCNYPLCNGDIIPLPYPMNTFIEIEAIATPGHTRGSITYIARPHHHLLNQSSGASFLFTGDTLFSGGSGVPFEADIDIGSDTTTNTCYPKKMTANAFVLASASTNAIERCFAEMLYRSITSTQDDDDDNDDDGGNVDIENDNDNTGGSNSGNTYRTVSNDQIIVCPGHEYTNELLSRQLAAKESINNWKFVSPINYFTTVSHYYTVFQRRFGLPNNTGKLLCAISTVETELFINPHFRNMISRSEILLQALLLWNRNWSTNPISIDDENFNTSNHRSTTTNNNNDNPGMSSTKYTGAYGVNERNRIRRRSRTAMANGNNSAMTSTSTSTRSQWNLTANAINQTTFTTLYTNDVDMLINDLYNNRLSTNEAAIQLEQLCTTSLFTNIVSRRPIPGTLPNDKTIYRGLLALALLGSSPCGLTEQDAIAMKLNKPINFNSDCIPVSKQRLISVLYHLGLLDENHNGNLIVAIIHNVWKEANEYRIKSKTTISNITTNKASSSLLDKQKQKGNNTDDLELQEEDSVVSTESSEIKGMINHNSNNNNTTTKTTTYGVNGRVDSGDSYLQSSSTIDAGAGDALNKAGVLNDNDSTNNDDIVPLGTLKWIIYGIPEQQKSANYFNAGGGSSRIKDGWFSSICRPCTGGGASTNSKEPPRSSDMPSRDHPAGKSNWSVHAGELVRHDVVTCKISQSATGYDHASRGREILVDTSSHHQRSQYELSKPFMFSTTHVSAIQPHISNNNNNKNNSNNNDNDSSPEEDTMCFEITAVEL